MLADHSIHVLGGRHLVGVPSVAGDAAADHDAFEVALPDQVLARLIEPA